MQDCTPVNLASAESPANSPRFAATLLPSAALPRTGFRALLINCHAMIYLSIIAFIFLGGAWVAVLWCLDAALCYGVYRWKYVQARLSETVELTEEKLSVTRIYSSGKTESWDFNPYWVRVEHRRRQGEAGELWLGSHGRKLTIGSFLLDSEKASFAQALSAALASQRCQVPLMAAEA